MARRRIFLVRGAAPLWAKVYRHRSEDPMPPKEEAEQAPIPEKWIVEATEHVVAIPAKWVVDSQPVSQPLLDYEDEPIVLPLFRAAPVVRRPVAPVRSCR